MRLLIDQNLSRYLPELLAAAGFDVADTRTLGMQRWVDEPLATDEERKEPLIMFRPGASGHHRVDVYAMNRDVNRDLALKPQARKNLERYLVVFTPVERVS